MSLCFTWDVNTWTAKFSSPRFQRCRTLSNMEDNCCCGRSNAIAPDSLEAKDVRKKAARFLLRLSWVQIVASVLSIITGLVSIGVAVTNPTYPKINGHAVVNGILVLIAGVYGRRATEKDVVEEVGVKVRAYITIHFTLCITCISLSVLQIIFNGLAVSECFSANQDTAYKCQPYETANACLGLVAIFLGLVLFITSAVGSTFLCSYKRVFAFMDPQDRIQKEIAMLNDTKTQQEATFKTRF
ncbi:uncharacterized protein LOC124266769 [Haliotis rubra]|uniref:uncharacterized protein LOC124266769 n=1 Tax=Haliotis rubra TaxID=36100 RepID=UPI001EE56AEB|nr:uncharacterized protein LOC124266769 [Haliotis rubra]